MGGQEIKRPDYFWRHQRDDPFSGWKCLFWPEVGLVRAEL